MDKKFDMSSLLKACIYDGCQIFVVNRGESVADEISALSEPELYDMLLKPDAASVDYIHTNYCHVEWIFYDRGVFQFQVDYDVEEDVEEDSVHFRYDRFNLKTKCTLINILKSQSEWHNIGIAMYDNETEDIIADSWFDASETKSDGWIHAFEDLCNEYVINSRYASLCKTQEEEDGNTVDVLDLVIDTKTYNLDDEDEEWDEDSEGDEEIKN